jgi:hypothetical protein
MARRIPLESCPSRLVGLKKATCSFLSAEGAGKVAFKAVDFEGHQGARRTLVEGEGLLRTEDAKA